jgi:hypothetical protein
MWLLGEDPTAKWASPAANHTLFGKSQKWAEISYGDIALIENPMEDRGIALRRSVPVRRITLQIALDEY